MCMDERIVSLRATERLINTTHEKQRYQLTEKPHKQQRKEEQTSAARWDLHTFFALSHSSPHISGPLSVTKYSEGPVTRGWTVLSTRTQAVQKPPAWKIH